MTPASLATRACWVFDLDGTLTVAAHDFDAIRAELGLPPGAPILEALDALEPREAEPLRARLHSLEWALADEARRAPGARRLLGQLAERGVHLSILTRNDTDIAWRTLEVIGLAHHFSRAHVLGRDDAPPKPSPAGVQRILDAWRVRGADAVMVGNGLWDLQAGRAAGLATVLVGAAPPAWLPWADLAVSSLEALISRHGRGS